MISLLFSTSFWYDVLFAICVVLVIIACFKFPNAKWVVSIILGIAIVVFTCYSAIQLNYYYSASGGIYGQITGIFNTNVVEVEELKFSLTNIELVKEHDDTYSAKVLNSNVIKLNSKDNFVVYVNDGICSISQVENEEDFCIANYTYSFFGEDKSLLCKDTLTFRFAFYTNSTYLSVSTNGGADAVKYWNYYFNKNVFEIRLEKIDLFNDKKISINTGDTSNFDNLCMIEFVALPGSYCSENGEMLFNKSAKTVGVQFIEFGNCATEPVIDFSNYFYDIVYLPSTSYVYSNVTVSGAIKPEPTLIKYNLVSYIFSLTPVVAPSSSGEIIGIDFNTQVFNEDTIVYILPIYETV